MRPAETLVATLQLPKIARTQRDIHRGFLFALGFIIFGNAFAQKISEIVSVSSFISEVNANNFLYVLCLSSVVSLAAGFVQSRIVDRCDRLNLLKYFSICLGFSFLALRILYVTSAPRWFVHGSFYLLSEQQFTFFPIVFWVLASDTLDRRHAKRLFPRLSAIGFVGNLAGIGIAASAPALSQWLHIHSQEFLTIDVLVYAVIFGILAYFSRQRRLSLSPELSDRDLIPSTEPHDEPPPLPQIVASSYPAFYPLAIAILASISVEAIVEYRFFIVSSMTFQSMDTYQLFLSVFTLARTLAYIIIQRFITERVMNTIALKSTFMILPVGSLFSMAAIALAPGLWGVISGFSFQKLPQYSLDETARKTLLGFVPKAIRGRLSLCVDSYLVAVGTIFGCGLVVTSNLLAPYLGISDRAHLHIVLGVLLATIAIVATWNMQQKFEASFPTSPSIRSRSYLRQKQRQAVSKRDRELTLIGSRTPRD